MVAHSFQVMAYLTLAATAAAAQSAALAKLGQTELQWMKICDMYGKFCNQIGEGIATALLVSLSMVVLSAISAFSLFRLYGENKEKSSGDGKILCRWYHSLDGLFNIKHACALVVILVGCIIKREVVVLWSLSMCWWTMNECMQIHCLIASLNHYNIEYFDHIYVKNKNKK